MFTSPFEYCPKYRPNYMERAIKNYIFFVYVLQEKMNSLLQDTS